MSDMPPPSPGLPAKKGLPPLAWAGIGCGGLLLVVGIAVVIGIVFAAKKISTATKNPSKTAANLVVGVNPEIEKVSENEETGEMTIRIKKTGEQVALQYKDLAEGRIVVKDADGKETSLFGGDLAAVPTWVPRYPKAADEKLVVQRNEATQTMGVISFSATASDENIKDFFAKEAGSLGMSSSSSSSSTLGGTTVFKLGYSGGKRELQVDGYSTAAGTFSILTTYTEKK